MVISKCLNRESEVLLMDEPTRGVDVGAKQEIHDIIRNLAGQGKGIIVFSSELPEIVQLCDRIVLMNEGQVRAVLDNGKGIDSDRIMALVAGGEERHDAERPFHGIVRDPKFLMLLLLVVLNVFFALTSPNYLSCREHLQHAETVVHGHHGRLGGHHTHDDGQLRPVRRQQPGADRRCLHTTALGGMPLWPAAVIALAAEPWSASSTAPWWPRSFPPFIATLGMMYIARGLALILANGTPVRGEKVPPGHHDPGPRLLAGGPHPRLLPGVLRRSCSW